MPSYFSQYTDSLNASLRSVEVTDSKGTDLSIDEGLDRLCEYTRALLASGNKQFLIGNGASAAFADHMALDWTKNGRIPTMAFTGNAYLTAVANDIGYENAFAAGIEWYADPEDLLVAISSSGNSPNVIKAIEAAGKVGVHVVTLSGLRADNASRRIGHLNLYVPAKTYGMVECIHQVILHMWLDCHMKVCEWDRDSEQNMRSDSFQL